MGLRDEILGNRTFPISPPIEVPGWKGLQSGLHFRTLTANDSDRIDKKAIGDNFAGFRALFAALVLSDKDGKRVFNDKDVAALGEMPHDPLSWILDNGKAWNAIGDQDLTDMAGNSPPQPDDSGSESPATGE